MSEKVRALDPPMCKVCHHRHWMREPHVFGKAKAAAPKIEKARAAQAAAEAKPVKAKPKKRKAGAP